MSQPMKVSVCVPAYERPKMIRELIASFRVQDLETSELCIADDSETEAVASVVAATGAGLPLVYEHNLRPLGFAANLWKALSMASGDVIVILGDDDLLADASALSTYARAFSSHPSVHFCVSSLLQVDDTLSVTLAYPRAKCPEVVVRAGEDALRDAWLTSMVITGLGFRRSTLLRRYYPSEPWSPGIDRLYPQVELVGRLCLEQDAILLGRYLCAFRAHARQLGFEAAKGNGGLRPAAHALDELPWIAEQLAGSHPGARRAPDICAAEFSRQYRTNVLNECLLVGVRPTRRRVITYVRSHPDRPGRPALLFSIAVASILPAGVLRALKNAARRVVAQFRLRRAGVDREAVRRFLMECARRDG